MSLIFERYTIRYHVLASLSFNSNTPLPMLCIGLAEMGLSPSWRRCKAYPKSFLTSSGNRLKISRALPSHEILARFGGVSAKRPSSFYPLYCIPNIVFLQGWFMRFFWGQWRALRPPRQARRYLLSKGRGHTLKSEKGGIRVSPKASTRAS